MKKKITVFLKPSSKFMGEAEHFSDEYEEEETFPFSRFGRKTKRRFGVGKKKLNFSMGLLPKMNVNFTTSLMLISTGLSLFVMALIINPIIVGYIPSYIFIARRLGARRWGLRFGRWIRKQINRFKSTMNRWWKKAKKWAGKQWTKFKNWLKKGWKKLKGFGRKVLSWADEHIPGFKRMRKFLSEIGNKISKAFRWVGSKVKKLWETIYHGPRKATFFTKASKGSFLWRITNAIKSLKGKTFFQILKMPFEYIANKMHLKTLLKITKVEIVTGLKYLGKIVMDTKIGMLAKIIGKTYSRLAALTYAVTSNMVKGAARSIGRLARGIFGETRMKPIEEYISKIAAIASGKKGIRRAATTVIDDLGNFLDKRFIQPISKRISGFGRKLAKVAEVGSWILDAALFTYAVSEDIKSGMDRDEAVAYETVGWISGAAVWALGVAAIAALEVVSGGTNTPALIAEYGAVIAATVAVSTFAQWAVKKLNVLPFLGKYIIAPLRRFVFGYDMEDVIKELDLLYNEYGTGTLQRDFDMNVTYQATDFSTIDDIEEKIAFPAFIGEGVFSAYAPELTFSGGLAYDDDFTEADPPEMKDSQEKDVIVGANLTGRTLIHGYYESVGNGTHVEFVRRILIPYYRKYHDLLKPLYREVQKSRKWEARRKMYRDRYPTEPDWLIDMLAGLHNGIALVSDILDFMTNRMRGASLPEFR